MNGNQIYKKKLIGVQNVYFGMNVYAQKESLYLLLSTEISVFLSTLKTIIC